MWCCSLAPKWRKNEREKFGVVGCRTDRTHYMPLIYIHLCMRNTRKFTKNSKSADKTHSLCVSPARPGVCARARQCSCASHRIANIRILIVLCNFSGFANKLRERLDNIALIALCQVKFILRARHMYWTCVVVADTVSSRQNVVFCIRIHFALLSFRFFRLSECYDINDK